MKHSDSSVKTMIGLRDIGVKLAIDDFGTGYSSLSYLKRFPLYELKIDRSFVEDVTADPDDIAIVTAIIGMAHSLKLKVVAEGVETDEQREFLCHEGCEWLQGFCSVFRCRQVQCPLWLLAMVLCSLPRSSRPASATIPLYLDDFMIMI